MCRKSDPPSVERSRRLAALMLLAAGGIGAAVRFGGLTSPWLAKYGGDAVWAGAWMFLVLLVRPRLRVEHAALIAGGICACIEFFQLTSVPAALAPRGFLFRLLLGSTFGRFDLAAYAAGLVAAWAIVKLLTRARRSRERDGYPAP